MPLVLDIFGVIYLQSGLNKPLLERCAFWRKQGEKIYGASNMTAMQNHQLWQEPGVRDAFDEIFCSGLLGVSKPDPVFFTTVSAKLGIDPQHLLFFDDSGTNVEAANRVGWVGHAYTDVKDLSTIAEGFFTHQHAQKHTENSADRHPTDPDQ